MSYIQDERHFVNYLNKVLREVPSIEPSDLLPAEFYIEEIYKAGIADDYTWALKDQGAYLLKEEHVLRWLAQYRKQRIREDGFTHSLTSQFLELTEDLAELCGVYSFWRHSDDVLYVGRSIRLGERVLTSFRDHFRLYDRPVYLRYIHTNSAPDAAILELYFISTLNPPLNRQDNFATEELTLQIEPIPEWSDRVRCNIVVHESGE